MLQLAPFGRSAAIIMLLRGWIKKLPHQLYGRIMESFWPIMVGKNSVRDLQYGPKTQLIRGTCIYTQWRTKESYYPPVLHPVLKPHPQLCPWRSRSHRISPMFMLPLSLGETQVQLFYRVLIDDLTKWLWKQVIVGDYREDDTQHYYMAKIVCALWLAAKWARCSCNDWA